MNTTTPFLPMFDNNIWSFNDLVMLLFTVPYLEQQGNYMFMN
jgi:hypothetical protein